MIFERFSEYIILKYWDNMVNNIKLTKRIVQSMKLTLIWKMDRILLISQFYLLKIFSLIHILKNFKILMCFSL
jgi:hypothetical protein